MAVVVPYAINIGISIALSYAAGKLLEKTADGSPVTDYKATPLCERGSPITQMNGRDEIGPVMTWAGGRDSFIEDTGGGKGMGTSGSDAGGLVYTEDGWHMLGVGPARRLWFIRENGKPIFKGPIDNASHPSGTVIDLGSRGKFRIFWGEQDQPVNERLGESDALGIESRWPFMFYVEWINKRLGPSPVWGRLTYDVEVWPYATKLVASAPWFQATKSLVGDPIALETGVGQTVDGPAGTNFITIQSGSNNFKPSQFARLEDAGVPDGDYIVHSIEKIKVGSTKYRRIFFAQTLTGLDPTTATVQAYADNKDDGVNPAHTIYQYLFVPFPHGRGLNPDDFDIDSLEDVGVVCYQENLRATSLSTDFRRYDAVIAEIMQDIGCFLVKDPRTGKQQFRMIRENTDVATLVEAVITGPAPEKGNQLVDEDPASRRNYTFRDRERDYETTPVQIDDDGAASVGESYGQARVDMPIVRDFTTAATVAKRRNQEAYSNEEYIRIRANREAILLRPGQLLSIPGYDLAYLLMELDRQDADSGEVTLAALPNYYGVAASAAEIPQGGGTLADPEDADEDEVDVPFEVPQALNDTGEVLLSVARIRATAAVVGAQEHVSSDDVSYTLLGTEGNIHTGGTLTANVLATGESLMDIGPTIQAAGPDILKALDLSAAGKEAEWRMGRQVAVVTDGTPGSYELWFPRYLEALGGGQYRMREVLRHRYGTRKQAWSTGDYVVIFERDNIQRFSDLLIGPDTTIFVKSLPIGGEAVLDDLVGRETDLYGQGVRPLPVTALRAGDSPGRCSNSYKFPNDVSIRWGYATAPGADGINAAPAGLPAGNPVLARPPADGTVRVRITDPNDGDAELRVTDIPLDTLAELVYTQAQIKTDFGLSAGFTPTGASSVYPWDDAISPAPDNKGASDTAVQLRTALEGAGIASVSMGGFGSRKIILVTQAGFPGTTIWPSTSYTATLKFNAVGAAGLNAVCTAVRYNSSNVVQEAATATASQAIPSGGGTLVFTVAGKTWTAPASTDRWGMLISITNTTGLSLTAELVTGDGNSNILGDLFLQPFIDFDVEVSLIKNSQQSSLETISVSNKGGTTT